MNSKSFRSLFGAAILWAGGSVSAQAAITFQFNYLDAT